MGLLLSGESITMVLLLLLAGGSQAWSPTAGGKPLCFGARSWGSPSSPHRRPLLMATIYGEEGGSSWMEDDQPSTFAPTTSLAESLSRHAMAELARLAAAFSPTAVALKDIKDVFVVGVDEHHVDLSAVVCEASECVTLFCPITFPHSCLEESSLESCVLDNIHELDHYAEEELLQRETGDKDDGDYYALASSQDLQYPDWWVFAGASDDELMSGEFDTIKSLLNSNDFEDSITALAATESYNVQAARVASVGLAGIYLRAQVWSVNTESMVVDIPIQFEHGAVDTVQELRATILKLVAQTESSNDDSRTAEQLPSWWVEADDDDLQESCQSVRFLLNSEDYQPQVQALVVRQQQEHAVLQYAEVITVGPRGMMLGAKLTNEEYIEVVVSFSREATDKDDLYNLVDEAVTGVEEQGPYYDAKP